MTIACAFRFREGILLCADTQYTYTGIMKTQGDKIFSCTLIDQSQKTTNGRAIFAISGTVAYAKMLVEQCMYRLGCLSAGSVDVHTAQKEIERALIDVHRRHIYPRARIIGDQTSVDILLALWLRSGELHLFATSGTAIHSVSTYEVLGTGAYLAEYLLPPLCRSPDMSLEDLVLLTTHVLQETKDHVENCGGTSEFAVLKMDGTFGGIADYDISHAEPYSDEYKAFTAEIFYEAASGKEADAEAVRHRLDLFLTSSMRMQQERQAAKQKRDQLLGRLRAMLSMLSASQK